MSKYDCEKPRKESGNMTAQLSMCKHEIFYMVPVTLPFGAFA